MLRVLNLKYIDDFGCKFLGILKIDIFDIIGGLEWEFEVKLKFGGIEIIVSVRNVCMKEIVSVEINFFGDEL